MPIKDENKFIKKHQLIVVADFNYGPHRIPKGLHPTNSACGLCFCKELRQLFRWDRKPTGYITGPTPITLAQAAIFMAYASEKFDDAGGNVAARISYNRRVAYALGAWAESMKMEARRQDLINPKKASGIRLALFASANFGDGNLSF